MPGNNFYFVNKDATSEHLSQSSRSQWAQIQKHVQKGLRRPRKVPAKVLNEAIPLDDKALYNPTARSISCKSDPFSTASVHIDSTVRGLIYYSINYCAPPIWTYQPSEYTTKPHAFKTSITQLVSDSFEDELSMYSLLAASTSRLKHVNAFSFPGATDQEYIFTQKALHLMQEHISRKSAMTSENNYSLARCAVLLGASETFRGDFTTSNLHFAAALRLLAPKENVMHMTAENLQGQILMFDLFFSYLRLNPCIRDYEYDDRHSCSGAAKGDGLQEDREDPSVSTPSFIDADSLLLSLCELLANTIESFGDGHDPDFPTTSTEDVLGPAQWAHQRNEVIQNRLLAFEISDLKRPALTTALILWTLLMMNINPRAKVVEIMVEKLRTMLERIPSNEQHLYADVRLWILLVGCRRSIGSQSTCLSVTALKSKEFGFTSEVPGTIPICNDLSELLQALREGYLYHDPDQKSSTKSLADVLPLLFL